jgi:Arc/MetJ-type ribon-helix-helix transcriptional regulator
MDTEKITINVTPVDLGKIDVLVSQGLYSTRADFIRNAIRRSLDDNEPIVTDTISRQYLSVGIEHIGAAQLERSKARNERLQVRQVGMLVLGKDVTPDLADEVIEAMKVRGVLRGPAEVLERLKPKIDRVRG